MGLRWVLRHLCKSIIVVSLALMATAAPSQQVLNLRTVADSNTLRPSGGGTFSFDNPKVRGREGVPLFRAEASGVAGSTGIYLEAAGRLQTVVDESTPAPLGGTFTRVREPLFALGGVLFRGDTTTGDRGLFLTRSGVVEAVANSTTALPQGGVGFLGVNTSTEAFGDRVVFGAQLLGAPHEFGIYLLEGKKLRLLADLTTPVPFGVGAFTGIGALGVDSTMVAFVGRGLAAFGTPVGIYYATGTKIRRAVDLNTPVPGKLTTFSRLSPFISVDRGAIAFSGSYPQGGRLRTGLFVWENGSIVELVNDRTVVPGTGERLTAFSELDLSRSTIAVRAVTSATEGIYVVPVHDPSSVVRTAALADLLDGREVGGLRHELNGQDVVLWIDALSPSDPSDRVSGIYVAPSGAPAAVPSLSVLGLFVLGIATVAVGLRLLA